MTTQTNTRPTLRFKNDEITNLRSIPVTEALDLLELYWKADPEYQPTKNTNSSRLIVSVGSGVFELIATGEKWFDTHAEKGGGGAIDLAMHLHKDTFVKAVKRLKKELLRTVGNDK